jgi:hypothetical protein
MLVFLIGDHFQDFRWCPLPDAHRLQSFPNGRPHLRLKIAMFFDHQTMNYVSDVVLTGMSEMTTVQPSA